MRISQNHNNSNNVAGEARGKLSTRQRRDSNSSANENRPVISAPNNSKSAEVSISNEARRRLIQHRALFGEGGGATRQQQAEIASSVMDVDDSDEVDFGKVAHSASNPVATNPWSGQWRGVGGIGLLKSNGIFEDNHAQTDLISFFHNKVWRTISSTRGDDYKSITAETSHRFSTLANVYLEIRQLIEERFTGDELEEHLRWLSQGFDAMANQIAMGLAEIAERRPEDSRDTSAMSERELEQLRRKVEGLTPNIQEILVKLAHLYRQFALENGLITSENDMEALSRFLHSDEHPDSFFEISEMSQGSDYLG